MQVCDFLTIGGVIFTVVDILGEPTVRINYIGDEEHDDGVRFRLSYYSCPWDEEHQCGIQMQASELGGEFA